MAKQVFSRAQYLDILNDSLRRHPGWQPGMAFVFLPRARMRARPRAWAAPGHWRRCRSIARSNAWRRA